MQVKFVDTDVVELTLAIRQLTDILHDNYERYESLWKLVRAELDRRAGQTSLRDYQ